MEPNRTRFITELDERLESFITHLFFFVGVLSSIVSIFTLYLLAKKSSFCAKEIRLMLVILQISAFLNNFHFCILFVPFIYPYLGGGFCTGLLCMAGMKFHYGMTFWLLTIILLCSSFIVLLFARLQTLLHPWSKLNLSFSWRMAFYIYTYSSMLIIPILFLFSDTPLSIQEYIVRGMELDWIVDNKIYSVINGCDSSKIVLMTFITYSILGNIIVFGSTTAILFVMILHKILTSNVNKMSNQSQTVYRTKIKNSIVFLCQMILALCLGVLPLCVIVATIGIGVSVESQKIVLLCEFCTTTLSLTNSSIFIFGNKQYIVAVRQMFGMSKRNRSKSVSIGKSLPA